MNNGQIIFLDYPVNPEPCYGYGKPPHPELTEILNRNTPVYQKYFCFFYPYKIT
ncbi:hypothetical protein P378_10830 [Desulforamulus profundi]|uniref:Uncharacterized protein n=1 Tax=Desulforamulus profundi TaxID=1383067 RepID=A0A2C6MDX5_9FIRM|nr:hypothetical protein P378_10830 [Desulforamulus profundi]